MLQVFLDNQDIKYDFGEDLVFLGMYSCRCQSLSTESRTYLAALALRPRDVVKGIYERVGVLNVSDSGYDFYIANETDIDHSIVIV